MSPRRRLLACLSAGLLALGALALPATSSASALSEVEAAYNASGSIRPCEFTAATLSAALKQSTTYDYQYAADFTNAVQAALSARADGQCRAGARSGSTATPTGLGGAAATLGGADTRLPGSATSGTSAGLPLLFVLALGLVGLGLLALVGWGTLNLLGYEPRLARAARHSLREAEYRAGAGWTDLADRLRR